MNRYFGFAQCNECKDVEGPWILVEQRFLCESCYEKLMKKNEQLIKSKTESSTMTKPIGLSCDNPIFSGSASTSPKKQDMSLRD